MGALAKPGQKDADLDRWRAYLQAKLFGNELLAATHLMDLGMLRVRAQTPVSSIVPAQHSAPRRGLSLVSTDELGLAALACLVEAGP